MTTVAQNKEIVHAEHCKGIDGFDKVILREVRGCSAEVYLYGGHVTSWKNEHGEELCFSVRRESRRSPTYEVYSRSRRSRSRSYSPSHSRRHSRGGHADDSHRSRPRSPTIEFITEFGGSGTGDGPKLDGLSPPLSPPSQADVLSRSEHWSFNSCKND